MLKTISENDWIKFINQSINNSIYHHPVFLNVFKKEFDYKCFFKGNVPIVGIPLIKDQNNSPLRFQGYNGFLYANREKTKKQKVITGNFRALEEYANFFYENYKILNIVCDDTLIDTRPFIWHNYPKSQFKIEEYYTSKILLDDFSKDTISESRRQEINKSLKHDLKIEVSDDCKLAAKFFMKTVSENSLVDDEKIYFNVMKSLLKENMGKLLSCKIKNEVISYAFFGILKRKIFYMFAGSNKDFKGLSYHSLIIYNCLELLKKEFKEFDFVGVNSPLRGAFKMSFGGNLNRCWKLNLKR